MLSPDNENSPTAMMDQSAIPNSRLASPSRCLSPIMTQQTLVSCDGKVKPARNNAFSILMSSVKENEVWKEASLDKASGPPQGGGRRKAPFYKVLQGMPIAVDAFNYGEIPSVTAYFLTSVHHFTSSTRYNH